MNSYLQWQWWWFADAKGLPEDEEKVVEDYFLVARCGDVCKMMIVGVSLKYEGGHVVAFVGWGC